MQEDTENEEDKSNPFLDAGSCAMCHEEASLQTRPLGFVALCQMSKILQVAKQLQMNPPKQINPTENTTSNGYEINKEKFEV